MNSRTINTGITRIKFQNSHTVYENFIKCTIKDYEFNLSYNPSLLSGSQATLFPYSSSVGGDVFFNPTGSEYFGILKPFTTGSEFSPYTSEIGLYNDAGDLLAVAKLASPMPLSPNTDMTFLVKYDTQWINRPYFTPSVTPSMTPSTSPIPPTPTVTPSVTPSISVTPSVSKTPSVTPSATTSISVTPSVSKTPSVTPSISATPSVTPTTTPSISVTPSTTPPSSVSLLVYAKYINSGGTLRYSINSGAYHEIPLTLSSTCDFLYSIPGISVGDTVTFDVVSTYVIAGSSSSPCPSSGFGCSYNYGTVSGGVNYAYITVDGSQAC